MARARKVVNDTSSAVQDELRRQFHNLLLVLENVCNQVDAATITAGEGFTVLATTLATGVDASITGVGGGANNYTGTGRELNGVKPTPTHPRRARDMGTVDMGSDPDY